jgi:pentatricopeptide repeat protein
MSIISVAYESVTGVPGAESIAFLLVFLAGFIFFDSTPARRLFKRKRARAAEQHDDMLRKQLLAHAASGKPLAVVENFAAVRNVTPEVLIATIEAVFELGYGVVRLTETLAPRVQTLRSEPALVLAVVEAVRESSINALPLLADWLHQNDIAIDTASREVLVRGLAEQGLNVARWLQDARLPSSSYRALVEVAFQRKDWRQAKDFLRAMGLAGLYVPSHLTTALVRLMLENGELETILELFTTVNLSGEALTAVLVACEQRLAADPTARMQAFLERVVDLAAEKQVPMLYSSYETLVKALTRMRDVRALRTFDSMATQCCAPTETTCLLVLDTCIDWSNATMALHVLGYLRRGRAPAVAYEKAARAAYGARDFAALKEVGQDARADGAGSKELTALLKEVPVARTKGKGNGKGKSKTSAPLVLFMQSIRECSRARDASRALELLHDLRKAGTLPDTIACNAVLDVCVKAGAVRSARELLDEMKKARMADAASFNSMLNAGQKGGRALLSVADVDTLLAEMAACEVVPTQISYNAAMNVAVMQNDSQAAWRYFDEMNQRGYKADAYTCSILLKGMKDFRTREEVDRVFKLLESCSNMKADDVLVGALLDAAVRLKDGERIAHALNAVRNAGILPTAHAYTIVFRALANAAAGPRDMRWAEAQRAWEGMRARGLVATEGTYLAYVDCAVACGDWQQAKRSLEAMKVKGPAPTAAVYATVTRGLVLGRQAEDARRLYAEMKSLGFAVNLVTYNALVDAMAKVGDVEGAADLFRDMCAQGVAPDLVTFSTVIKAYCVQGDLEPAIQLFSLMRKRGLVPDQILFNSLLDGCAKKPMRSLAEQVLRDMEESSIPVSNYTVSILVKLYGRCGDMEEAIRVKEALSKKYGLEFSVTVQTCLIQAMLNHGRIEEAMQLFEQIRVPDAKTYSTVIRGCLKQHRVVEAVHVAESSLRAGVDLELSVAQEIAVIASRCRVTLPPRLANVASLHP